MIRGVVKNGVIHPLEPLPADWEDGREVLVDDVVEESSNGSADVDHWTEEMNALTAELNVPEEWHAIEEVLAEADRQNKALVRREMGLP
jgi:hypothetical protein